MSRTVNCAHCTKSFPDDEAYYVGPKNPCCSAFCSKMLIGDRESLLSISAGPLPPFITDLRTAIREQRKTQTRRIVKPQPLPWATRFEPGSFEGAGKVGGWLQMTDDAYKIRGLGRCPYGLAGQVRYLREPLGKMTEDGIDYAYYIDDAFPVFSNGCLVKWRWQRDTLPQIFMPKAYARTFVYMSAIRVEKLQDITEEDAIAEGCRKWLVADLDEIDTAKSDFAQLWNGINLKRGHGWDVDDWVWALIFDVILGGK